MSALTIAMYHYVRDLAGSRYPEIKGRTIEEYLAEMAVRSGVGFELTAADVLVESPSRVVVSVPAANVPELHRRHVEAGVSAEIIGKGGGDRLVVQGVFDIALADAVSAWRDRLPAALAGGTAQ